MRLVRRSGWGGMCRIGLAAILVVACLAVSTATGQTAAFDADILAQLNLRSLDHVVAVAMRFAPGPQGLVFFIAGVQNVDPNAHPPPRPTVERLFWYVPGHPEYATPQRVSGRQDENVYSFQNVRLTARHEGMETEAVLGGDLSLHMGRYLATDPYTLRGWWKSSARMTLRRGTESARFLVARDWWVTRVREDRQLRVCDLTQPPALEIRAVEGGRLVVANLTLGDTSGRGRTWTYYFPLQNADSQIRVDALDARGAAVETLQLRNTRGNFDQLDSWTGQFRRLQTGQAYTFRATVDLGMLGKLEETIPVTVFDF